MPLPVFFIGAAIATTTGVVGSGKTIKAVKDNSKAIRTFLINASKLMSLLITVLRAQRMN